MITFEEYSALERETSYSHMVALADEMGLNASKIRDEITANYAQLEGTPKQIAWACDIRNDLRDRNLRWYLLHKVRPGEYTEKQIEAIFGMVKKWLAKSNVKVFIDFRGTKMLHVAERRVLKGE